MANTEMHYIVDGMSCGSCKQSVIEEVTEIAGVTTVDVELETGSVTVRGNGLDDDTIQAAIRLAGYAPRPTNA